MRRTVINELPLLVAAGTPRNAVQFITFLPGVNTGTSPQAFNARINGGLKMGDEAVMDGVSMQEGTMSQSGMVSFFDFPTTPDMVSEVRVLTSSYEPQYGTTTGGEIMVTTRSGTDQFHGGAFEYFRNKDLNALQFTNNRGRGRSEAQRQRKRIRRLYRRPGQDSQAAFHLGTQAQDVFLPRRRVPAQPRRRHPSVDLDSVRRRNAPATSRI